MARSTERLVSEPWLLQERNSWRTEVSGVRRRYEAGVVTPTVSPLWLKGKGCRTANDSPQPNNTFKA
jgi:hypothetical protein